MTLEAAATVRSEGRPGESYLRARGYAWVTRSRRSFAYISTFTAYLGRPLCDLPPPCWSLTRLSGRRSLNRRVQQVLWLPNAARRRLRY